MNWQALSAIASVVTALAVLAIALVVAVVSREVHTTSRELRASAERLRADVTPLLGKVDDISNDVRAVTQSIRDDVDRVHETVASVTGRVQQALVVSEERLGEFNALLQVVQEEAERLFVSTASAVRGVGLGAQAFRERGGTDLASDELDAAAEADATTNQEVEDGNDSSPESAAPALTPGPRVRPRPGHRRRA
ncbi:MAG: hypothetical protein ACREPM_13035 [Gemmatimonadaceae bacterium]